MEVTHLGSVFAIEDKTNETIITCRVNRNDRRDTVTVTAENLKGVLLARTTVGLEDMIGWLEKLRRDGV